MNIVGIASALTLLRRPFGVFAINSLSDAESADFALKGAKLWVELLILKLEGFDDVPRLVWDHRGWLDGQPLSKLGTLLIEKTN